MKSIIDIIKSIVFKPSVIEQDKNQLSVIDISALISARSNSLNIAAVQLATEHELHPGKSFYIKMNEQLSHATNQHDISPLSNVEWNKMAMLRAEKLASAHP